MTEKSEIIPIEENRLFFLFRRGQKEYVEALYNDGIVYINSIDYIRECDNNAERSDKDDGILSREFFGNGTVTVWKMGKDPNREGVKMEAVNMYMKTDHSQKGNIYCLTGVYSENLTGDRTDITLKTESFGDTVLFIHSPTTFLDRLSGALIGQGYKGFNSGRVEYYPNDYSGSIGFFKKHERFKHQNEYRIFVPNSQNEPIKLTLGSLHDIAYMNPGFVKLTYSDGKELFIR